jgi:cob(I)alamin adenosyltransferase
MANRLSQIATRTGDNGTTGLGDNTRVSKDSLRVHAMGDVDELNSHIGVLLCEELPPGVRELLVEVQHQLFNLGGELSIPGFELLKPEAVALLDEALAEHNARCRAWLSSSCPPARAPLRWRMCAAPWRAAPNAPWWRWVPPSPSRTRRASTSTA